MAMVVLLVVVEVGVGNVVVVVVILLILKFLVVALVVALVVVFDVASTQTASPELDRSTKEAPSMDERHTRIGSMASRGKPNKKGPRQ